MPMDLTVVNLMGFGTQGMDSHGQIGPAEHFLEIDAETICCF
jgi:hypothetical protein